MIDIFCDGSSLGNPGASGWGSVVLQDRSHLESHTGGAEHATNNQMEMTAVLFSLAYMIETFGVGSSATIYCDSKYVIDGSTKWLSGWKRNGWRSSKKTPVANVELWKQIDVLLHSLNIDFKHVKAHTNKVTYEANQNRIVDALAYNTAQTFK